MNKKKQIEEMAKTVCHLDRTCDQCMTSFECKAMTYAKRFYNAGYRKAPEVAREIFEEVDKLIIRRMRADIPLIDDRLVTDIAELKKKYTEGGGMKSNREAKKRKYYRKCGDCGKRFEQSLMIRTNKSPNGWFCCDCYVDFHIAEHPEFDIDEW